MSLRLKTLQLSWFRGAAGNFALNTKGKCVVIYGPNGAGKSSLVDALEYVLTSGKVGHLANEYSGKRLEHAVPNIKTPANTSSAASVTLQDGNEASVSLGRTGMPKSTGGQHVATWSPARSILRQDAVTGFVMSTKADKYKAVLPLLGFEPLEIAASNLRAIKLEIDKLTQLERKEGRLEAIRQRRHGSFPGMNAAAIGTAIKSLFAIYLPAHPPPQSLEELVNGLKPELQRRLDSLDADNRVHALLCQARDAKLAECLAKSMELALAAAQKAQPLLAEGLAVLKSAGDYAAAMQEASRADTIECPACGQSIAAEEFAFHVARETEALADALDTFNVMATANKETVIALQSVQVALRDPILDAVWLTEEWVDVGERVRELVGFQSDGLVGPTSGREFTRLQELVEAVMPRVAAAAGKASASTQALLKDRDAVLAASDWDGSRTLRKEIKEAERLTKFLDGAESSIRDEIRLRSAAVIKTISNEVATMWAVLHPDEPIDEVGLYQHADADKAVDLTLRFHGKTQLSPRLTLSEGHRNSLGLCVFLALAKRGEEPSPIVLDDVVTSFDREHRASVTDLLIRHMDGFQVIVLTHEYDWFIDLHNRLSSKLWDFQQLRPFSDPAIGIQWSTSPVGFEPARAMLDFDASSAANKARGLLDQHLAVVSERLKISMPFIRGPRNELRHAEDMLQRFAGRAAMAFKIKSQNGNPEPFANAAQVAIDLKQLLVPFANPPSHGRVATRGEAERIISCGEAFLAVLRCEGCSQTVYRSEVQNKYLECECGTLRWIL